MGAFAWVTLATNDSYSLGALVLAHSLKQAGTAHQLAVLVTPGVTSAMRDKLASVFNVVQEVNILDSRDEANLRLLKRPELGVTFTKLHCWRLTQFEKCVFLDADTLVLQNADELFEREELSAAPDVGWPDCFNSGVFVYRPSLDTYEKLIQFALEKGSFDGGDQGLLNLFFADWAHKDINKHLPFIYNVCSTACYSYLPAFKQFGGLAKIIHFIGHQKPWLQYFNTETRRVQPSGDASHLQDVLQRWWDIFCSLIHPHLSPAMAGLAGAFSQLTLGVARTPEQDALDNILRKQAWEVGNIDYLGRDSFENIWSKISETLSAAPPPPQVSAAPAPEPSTPSPPQAPAAPTEPEIPSAPAESQSQTARQEEASPVQPQAARIGSPDKVSKIDTPKIDSPQSSIPVESKEQQTVESPIVTSTGKESETTNTGAELKGSAVTEPIGEVSKEPSPVTSSEEVVKPEAFQASAEQKLATEKLICSLPSEKTKTEEVKVSEPQPTQQQLSVAKSVPESGESKQSDATASTPTVQSKTENLEETAPAIKEKVDIKPEAEKLVQSASTPKQKLDISHSSSESTTVKSPPVAASSVTPPPAKSSKSSDTPGLAAPPAAEKTVESSATPVAATLKASVASSDEPKKASPKTKVTEATPPATPDTPPAEKTKQAAPVGKAKEALTAEATVPETPPPTEGGSTPTPPPRKTDKPKKVAAKAKK